MKNSKKKLGGGGVGPGGSGWGRVGGGGQGGCERRIEVLVKIQKKKWGWGGPVGRGGGFMVDVNEELKFLGKFTKKKIRGGGGWGGGGGLGGGQGGYE